MARRGGNGPHARSPKDTFITVYGRMPVLEVLEDPSRHIDKIVVAERSQGDNLGRILDLAERRGVPVQYATANRVKLLAGNGKQDQGVLADVVAPRMKTIDEFVPGLRGGSTYNVLVLDGVNNPSNVGMIIRTATAAGVSGVVLPHFGSPNIDPLVIKASAGVAFRASILRSRTAAEATRDLKQAGFRIFGLSGDGRSSVFGARLPIRSAFVLGNETEGVSPGTADSVDEWLAIPMSGGVESLNVASAAAVLCFDLVRRAEQAPPAGPSRSVRPPTTVTTALVLLEFAGLGRDQSFADALPSRPGHSTLLIDPLTAMSRSVAGRAAETIAAIEAAGLRRVAVLGACSATALVLEVASAAGERGIEIAAAGVVDPVVVTARLIAEIVDDIRVKLGDRQSRASDVERALGLQEQPDPQFSFRLVRESLEKYIVDNECDQDEAELLREDVLDRYSAWLNFLADAMSASLAPAENVHFFVGATVPHFLDSSTATIVQHQLGANEPPLLSAKVRHSLHNFLANAGWIPTVPGAQQ